MPRNDLVERRLQLTAERPREVVAADQHHDVVAEEIVLAEADHRQAFQRRHQRDRTAWRGATRAITAAFAACWPLPTATTTKSAQWSLRRSSSS